jgi:hypothetical protein
MYVERDDHATGLVRLLTIALRKLFTYAWKWHREEPMEKRLENECVAPISDDTMALYVASMHEHLVQHG